MRYFDFSALDRPRWLRSTVALLLACSIVACGNRNDDLASEDELARASYLIDRKQYSEAIYVLKERLKRSPHEVKTRVVLASAYAARAGIAFSSYTQFSSELSKWNEIEQLLPSEDDQFFIQSVAKAAVRLQVVMRAFRVVPSLKSPDAVADAVAGLEVLKDAGNLNGGSALYRGLLRIVVFKQKSLTSNRPQIDNQCVAKVGEITRWLQLVSDELSLIFGDLSQGVSDGSTRTKLVELSRQVQSSLEDPSLKSLMNGIKLAQTIRVPPELERVIGPCR